MLTTLVTAAASYLLVETVGYWVHRLAHWSGSGKLFRDHLKHHAHAYPPTRYQTEKYLGDLWTSFLPVFVPIWLAVNVAAWLALPWHLATVFFAVTTLASLAQNFAHDAYHVSGHWLHSFRWYGRLTARHEAHHQNVKLNLGIYSSWLDKLFGTYRDQA